MEIGNTVSFISIFLTLRVQLSKCSPLSYNNDIKLLGLQTHMDSLVVENNAMKRRIQYLLENKSRLETVIRQNSLTTSRPLLERQQDSSYCAVNRCYNPKEFALFGVGAIIMGCMVGAVGNSWLKKLEVNLNQNKKYFRVTAEKIFLSLLYLARLRQKSSLMINRSQGQKTTTLLLTTSAARTRGWSPRAGRRRWTTQTGDGVSVCACSL